MSNKEVPPLPSQEDYFKAASELELIFDVNGGARSYLGNYFEQEHRRSTGLRLFNKLMTQYGLIIEPMDRTTFEVFDKDMKATGDVVKGGVAGLLLVGKTHGAATPTSQLLEHIGIGNPGTDDDDSNKDMIARQLIDKGWQGVELLGKRTADIIEKWEDQIAESRDPHLFRVGAGITAICAVALHQHTLTQTMNADFARFQSLVNSKRDDDFWNTELASLTGFSDPPTDPSQRA